MGSGLADNVVQGAAGTKEFRTAPLWGVGQRIFFMHDGRATPGNGGLVDRDPGACQLGLGGQRVIYTFNHIDESKKQDMLNFLRSL